jgi:hypothetical protein
MKPDDRHETDSRWLRRTDQTVVAVLVLAGLIAMAGYWISHGGFQGGLIEIDRAAPLTADFQLDINSAPWS